MQRANETDRINIRWNNIGYNRGGKGIQFDEPGTNGGIQPPVLIALLTRSIVIGRTCSDCVIDVFRSDLDPSGYGEGFQYLVSGHANGSGVININVEGLTLCDSLTTTVTDLQSRTSEFSTNYRGIDCTIPPVVYPFLIVLTVLIGITAVPRIWHKPGSLPNILIGFVGIIAVISLVVGILFLRFGSLPVNPNGNIPVEEDVPLCQNLIDSEKLQPPPGAIFPVEQPPTIAWNLVNDPGLQGEIRWQVELINPVAERETRKIDTTNIPLTMFDIATDIEGTYRWRVWAEWLNPQSGEWQVFCDEPVYWLFTLGEEIPPLEYPLGETTQTATETPVDVKTETPEPQDETPVARALVNLNCRQGPSELYGLTGNFREGETAVIEGRNANNTWWYLRPPQVTVSCWVLGSGVEVSGNLANLPLVTAPLLPTLTFTPTFTPTVTPSQTPSLTPSVTVSAPQCGDFKTQNECNSHANDMQCYWSQKDVCVKQ